MCKELKRLALLSECPHLNKTDRDAVIWAIQNLSPEQPDTPTSFGGWDFQSWPSVPDKRIFEELKKARKAKKGVIMTQAYIDGAGPHLHTLSTSGVTVNEALKPAIVGGWTSFQSNWVVNALKQAEVDNEIVITSFVQALQMVKSGQVTHVKQIPREHLKMIETQFRIGSYDPATMEKLTNIGMVI